jgi:VanZ family protein
VKRLFQTAAWLLLLAIIVLSVVPPEDRPVTPAPRDIEHLGIFLLTGLAFGLGYERRHFVQALCLIIFSAAIELVQLLIPGRHAKLGDFVVDALSTVIGVGLAALIPKARNHFRIQHNRDT